MVTREDVERAAWAASGWSVEQPVVDELMAAVDAYATAHCGGDLATADLVEVPVGAVTEPVLLALEDLEPVPPVVKEPATVAPLSVALDAKSCTRCGEVKPLDAFGRDKTTRSGYKARCKACLAAVKKEWKARQAQAPGDAP